MNLKEIKQRVAEIAELKEDFERDHSLEDDLYSDFVKYISETGNMKQRAMAFEILKTNDIDFKRYTA